MRLHVLSDLHIEHATFEMPLVEADVIVLAGDILAPGHKAVAWAASSSVSRGRPVLLVAGNHEFYESQHENECAAMGLAAQRSGVHFLNRTRLVVDGVRFLGCTLWTDFSLAIVTADGLRADAMVGMLTCSKYLLDYQAIRLGEGGVTRLLRPEDTLAMHTLDRDWLQQELLKPFHGRTVVVTHHAPHRRSLATNYEDDWASTGFVTDLPNEFFDVPALWVHGHTHTRFDYQLGGCRVVCNPRGYRLRGGGFEVDGFDRGLVVEV